MAFEAITSAVLNALGGNKDALGPVSGKAADDPGWLTSTGDEGTHGDIYWPLSPGGGFYWKKGEPVLNPALIPDEWGNAVPYNVLGSAIEQALQNEPESVRQAIEKRYGTSKPYVTELPEGTIFGKPITQENTPRLMKGAFWDPQGTGPDPSDPYSYWDDPKKRKGLPSDFLAEGVDPYRSLTQRALDVGLGIINPQRFGQQASTAISPNVMPSNWDDFYTDSPPKSLSGKALDKWLREGGTLQANTPSGIPDQPSEFRGITGEDVINQTLLSALGALAPRVLAGTSGVAAALYPTRMGDAYIGDPAEAAAVQSALKAARALDPGREAATTMGYMKPEEFGLDPFTNEQIREARATFQTLMEETPEEVSQYISPTADPYIYQDQVAEALQKAQAEQTLFTGEEVDVASRAPLDFANIIRSLVPPNVSRIQNLPGGKIVDGVLVLDDEVSPETLITGSSPFIGDEGFTPSLPATTLGGPVVGTTQAGVPSGFEALASLIQDDPSVAQKYISGAGPTAELANLVANTGVETFTDFPTEQPGAEVPWTPPAPVVPDITEELVDFSALQSAREAEAQRAQDKIDRQLEHAANVRRKDEEKARLASARNAKAEQRRIDKENKERAAEEKRIADKQAAEEKQRRATEKQMADMLKQMNETHQAYLARKREEEARRKRLGYGVGGMWT